MAGGDVDTGSAAVLPHGKGQLWGGAHGLKQAHLDPVGRHDAGGLLGEAGGVGAAVKANGNPLLRRLGALIQDHLGKGLGGVADDVDVHPAQA